MKRILSILIAALLLALPLAAANAEAEIYVEANVGYSFEVPEGWMAIDGTNAIAQLDTNSLGHFNEAIITALESLKGFPVVFLYEKVPTNTTFANNINVTYQDLGVEFDISELMPMEDAIVEGLKSMFPEIEISYPLSLVSAGDRNVMIIGSEYALNGDRYSLRQVRFAGGTLLYEITLTALEQDDVESYVEALFELVMSFKTPN